jgi:hypothetical protein
MEFKLPNPEKKETVNFDVPENVWSRYSFPESRQFMVKKFKHELDLNQSEKNTHFYAAVLAGSAFQVATCYGIYRYMYLFNPGGKVMRDLKDLKGGRALYWARRALPFAFLVGPTIFAREVFQWGLADFSN